MILDELTIDHIGVNGNLTIDGLLNDYRRLLCHENTK